MHDELEYQLGEGGALDATRFSVVIPNLLGNGVSFSPSRCSDERRSTAPPPLITVADNVRAQRALLRSLGVTCDETFPLDLVYGYSMGGLQACAMCMCSMCVHVRACACMYVYRHVHACMCNVHV